MLIILFWCLLFANIRPISYITPMSLLLTLNMYLPGKKKTVPVAGCCYKIKAAMNSIIWYFYTPIDAYFFVQVYIVLFVDKTDDRFPTKVKK